MKKIYTPPAAITIFCGAWPDVADLALLAPDEMAGLGRMLPAPSTTPGHGDAPSRPLGGGARRQRASVEVAEAAAGVGRRQRPWRWWCASGGGDRRRPSEPWRIILGEMEEGKNYVEKIRFARGDQPPLSPIDRATPRK
jgi:hypothetical protein